MAARLPAQCRDMTEVRAEIDRIDKALVETIAERFGYVERAWQLKLEAGQEANVPWRNQQVFDKVRARAAETGLPPDLIEALWRQMVGWFIQHEEEKLRDRLEGKPRGFRGWRFGREALSRTCHPADPSISSLHGQPRG